jgi:uncharacterized protein involved in type VI secretion and phage assembly
VRYERLGSGNVRESAPGRRLKLEGHPQQAYNTTEYS